MGAITLIIPRSSLREALFLKKNKIFVLVKILHEVANELGFFIHQGRGSHDVSQPFVPYDLQEVGKRSSHDAVAIGPGDAFEMGEPDGVFIVALERDSLRLSRRINMHKPPEAFRHGGFAAVLSEKEIGDFRQTQFFHGLDRTEVEMKQVALRHREAVAPE